MFIIIYCLNNKEHSEKLINHYIFKIIKIMNFIRYIVILKVFILINYKIIIGNLYS